MEQKKEFEKFEKANGLQEKESESKPLLEAGKRSKAVKTTEGGKYGSISKFEAKTKTKMKKKNTQPQIKTKGKAKGAKSRNKVQYEGEAHSCNLESNCIVSSCLLSSSSSCDDKEEKDKEEKEEENNEKEKENNNNENEKDNDKEKEKKDKEEEEQVFDKRNKLIKQLLGIEFAHELKVAKKCIMDEREYSEQGWFDITTYFNDVRTQCEAQRFANEYNGYDPPKKIAFLASSVILLADDTLDVRDRFYCVEDYLHGSYIKHLDNHGGDEQLRNTPAAFAHFTYEASNNRLLVCDIQGVGDLYTDPQIHTFDGRGFGKGNLGIDGMVRFLRLINAMSFATLQIATF
ncbi:myosin heavy chain kinase [Reticulomyxa filosa]|uniref:Myosin heavy chain kinase n=1 Tax=Reticulomyxa filosa TaxID=46433 RepID=X6MW72_RETFI|nr:myosin heavy chain kinase [Reticulomyxa filosa]|eukprot:ETO18248.1 myosin heavy chain kinase [Reticulomyxa filosa]